MREEINLNHMEPSPRELLTDRQRQVLDFIRRAIRADGFPPTVRDIAGHLGIISLNAIRRHLQALEKKGFIVVEPGKSRGIRIVGDDGESLVDVGESRVPLLGHIAAGPFSTAVEDVEDHFLMDPGYWGDTAEVFLLRVRGDSMSPRLEPGDLVAVHRQSHASPGDLVVAIVDDEATVKELVMTRQGTFLLHPANPAYDDIPLGPGFSINGKVIGLIRKF